MQSEAKISLFLLYIHLLCAMAFKYCAVTGYNDPNSFAKVKGFIDDMSNKLACIEMVDVADLQTTPAHYINVTKKSGCSSYIGNLSLIPEYSPQLVLYSFLYTLEIFDN